MMFKDLHYKKMIQVPLSLDNLNYLVILSREIDPLTHSCCPFCLFKDIAPAPLKRHTMVKGILLLRL